jgi:hypothetical protein
VSCRIGAEIPACAPMAGTDSGFFEQLSLRCFQRIFPCFYDAPRQFHHHPCSTMTVLLDHADPVILIETYGMGPVGDSAGRSKAKC